MRLWVMKSRVKYIDNFRNWKLRREIYELLIESFKSSNVTRICGNNYYYDMLLYAKYVIEREHMDYSKIVDGDVDQLLVFLKERFKGLFTINFTKNFKDAKLYEILKKMAFEDYEIAAYRDRFLDVYLDKSKKYLLISSYKIPYIVYPNVDIYDVDMNDRQRFVYELYDEITGNKRNYYTSFKDIDLSKYETVIYLNDDVNNIDYRDNVFYKHKIYLGGLMVCWYSNISKFKGIFETVEEVFLDKNKAYVRFYKDVKKYDIDREQEKLKIREISEISDDELKTAIHLDDDSTSVMVSREEFINHGRRIGFRIYKSENKHEKLLRLIDYNKMITNKIDNLNEEIASQIDKLFVK